MKLDPREIQNISRDINNDDSILETTGRTDKYFQPGIKDYIVPKGEV